MLDFVTAEESSMDEFLSVSEGTPFQAELRQYAQSLLEQEYTKPEWCLVGLEAARPVVRAALWAPPGRAGPTDTVLIAAPWEDEHLSAGRELMTWLHELAGHLGADGLNHSVDSPPASPQYQENEEARIRLMERSGYELLRDGLRWRYSASAPADAPPAPSLAFRTLAEVGEDAFVEAIAATYQGTRDSWIAQNIEELGPVEAARDDFREQQSMEYRPEWWELAYTADGALAGVSMAARNPSVAVVSYVGVVPEQRGRGLAAQLVRRGTERLLRSGADEIRGDCDRDNVAMVKAFLRAGYEEFARRRTYRHAISSS
jgi:ribosomal protein S18 acetylase RimI-like enzyme